MIISEVNITNNSNSKLAGLHIFNTILTLAFFGTMFLNIAYGHSYYGYYRWNYTFFEATFDDVLPGIVGVFIMLLTLASFILNIVAASGKKVTALNIVPFIIPFMMLINYILFLIILDQDFYISSDAYILFIPIVLMIIISISGIVSYSAAMKAQRMNNTQGNMPYAAPVMNGAPAAALNPDGKKFCTHCGNECVAQAVICTKCGSAF